MELIYYILLLLHERPYNQIYLHDDIHIFFTIANTIANVSMVLFSLYVYSLNIQTIVEKSQIYMHMHIHIHISIYTHIVHIYILLFPSVPHFIVDLYKCHNIVIQNKICEQFKC